MVVRLERAAQPEEIILFGSRARGQGREGTDEVSPTNPNRRGPSDADFLVILPKGTPKDLINVLLLSVPQMNAGLPFEMELHPRAGDALCEELRIGLPKISTCAVKEGLIFYPRDRSRSIYQEFADAWRLANHIRLWFYPAKADLESAQAQFASGLLEGAGQLTLSAVRGALHGLLIAAGGDIPSSDNPMDVIEEISDLDAALGAGLATRRQELRELAELADPVSQETVRVSLALADWVVQYVEKAVEAKLEPAVPCPAG